VPLFVDAVNDSVRDADKFEPEMIKVPGRDPAVHPVE
jgi:hypothetical protein